MGTGAGTSVQARSSLLLRIDTECFELPGPFGGSVAQPLDVDASRQAALDRGSDQVGREEGERVDSQAASLAGHLLLQVQPFAIHLQRPCRPNSAKVLLFFRAAFTQSA